MANSPQKNVSSHVLVVFRKKRGLVNITVTFTTVTSVIYYRRAMMNIAGFPHFPVCRLLLIGLFPRLCVWLLHLSLHVLLLSLSRSFRLSISLSFFFVFFHQVSPLSSRPPPSPSPPPSLSLSPPSLCVPFANCLRIFLFVSLF